MEHIAINLTDEQRTNLQKLANFLKGGVPGKFDMSTYCYDVDDANDYEGSTWFVMPKDDYHCGTAACAVGWAPYAGIGKHHGSIEWYDYAKFYLVGPSDTTFDWCFDGRWVAVDNTPEGAAARIEYMLEHGVPADYEDQMRGCAALCYKGAA